ncbi:MAG: PTS sugar transporter subunit IIA [Caulobacteraceae bacterium]|nr:PTS sugar transporter subunit IIA [Caulobacter sp.]
MDIGDLLDPGAVVERAGGAKRQALSAVAEVAARQFGGDAAAILALLSEREAQGSTGVGAGVALPHAELPGLERMRAVFLRLEEAAPFEAVDDQPVDLVFALFAPPGAGADHLRALARASRLLRRREIREQLRKARSPAAMHAVLAQEAAPAPA